MKYQNEPVFYKEGKVYWRGEILVYDWWVLGKDLTNHPIVKKHNDYIKSILYEHLWEMMVS